jgi:hypothetical protein
MSYEDDAMGDAREFIADNIYDIITIIKAGDEIGDHTDLPGGNETRSTYSDNSFSLQESADILDELGDYEETDSGLWEGCTPIDAVCMQAAYTYSNAVCSCIDHLLTEISNYAEESHSHRDNIKSFIQKLIK